MRSLLRASCWLLLALPFAVQAQVAHNSAPATPSAEILGGEKTKLLTAARSQYYNLRAAGLKSYGCTVEIDWNGFIAQVTGAPLADDDPTLKYLNGSRLSFVDDLKGKPEVKWAFTGTPPERKAQATGSMTHGMVQVVQGFLQAWTPSQNGTLISLNARSFKRAGTGYTIDDAGGSNIDLLTLDKDFAISHASIKNDETVAESDFTFVPSANGLCSQTSRSTTRFLPRHPRRT